MIEAEKLLDECKFILLQRGEQYGDATPLYKTTAALWSAYSGADLLPEDVCTMMALMKIGRLIRGVEGVNPARLAICVGFNPLIISKLCSRARVRACVLFTTI